MSLSSGDVDIVGAAAMALLAIRAFAIEAWGPGEPAREMDRRGDTVTDHRNVFGEPLAPCCTSPMTGFFRTGSCETGAQDRGAHVVCAQVTEEFLAFTRSKGNDLESPVPEFGFPGLKPGDRWCVCAAWWKLALDAGVAPPVVLGATHESALSQLSLDDLKKRALDIA